MYIYIYICVLFCVLLLCYRPSPTTTPKQVYTQVWMGLGMFSVPSVGQFGWVILSITSPRGFVAKGVDPIRII